MEKLFCIMKSPPRSAKAGWEWLKQFLTPLDQLIKILLVDQNPAAPATSGFF
jgi:hypothetical protein